MQVWHYYKIEVLEDFAIERKLKSGFVYVEECKKGEVIISIHGLDSKYSEAVKEGKIKVLENR